MKWIVITMPDFIENEANNINQLFEAGLDLLHLRKPESCIDDCERLLQEINPKWYPSEQPKPSSTRWLPGKPVTLLPYFQGGNSSAERSSFQLRLPQSYLR